MRVQSLGREDPLEEGMATHSSILAWRIPWIEESGELWSIGLQSVRHNWSDLAHAHWISCSSPCYTVGLCCLSILHIIAYICYPCLPLRHSPNALSPDNHKPVLHGGGASFVPRLLCPVNVEYEKVCGGWRALESLQSEWGEFLDLDTSYQPEHSPMQADPWSSLVQLRVSGDQDSGGSFQELEPADLQLSHEPHRFSQRCKHGPGPDLRLHPLPWSRSGEWDIFGHEL